MKDLFKGHHPWLLVLVIAVDIFSALVIRHSILSKGESEFNANVFFCLIIIGGLALYAILVEFLSGQDMPLIGEKKGKEEMAKVPVSRPITEETSVERPTVPLEQASVSRDDLEQIMRDVMADLKREVAVPTNRITIPWHTKRNIMSLSSYHIAIIRRSLSGRLCQISLSATAVTVTAVAISAVERLHCALKTNKRFVETKQYFSKKHIPTFG